eukprot:c15143_g1_i1.p1 GENE.c15143_g1_i1~~c15143_g1_i1.p1  ORF type:complete len:174 (-),score=32.00 c15143_g1_i1:282-803(-)
MKVVLQIALALSLVLLCTGINSGAQAQVANTPQPCEFYTSCAACLMFSNERERPCGWCASENQCLSGTLNGPAGRVNCTFWDFGFCSGEPCATYTNPIICHQDPFCVWCRDPPACMEGTPTQGPLFGSCDTRDFDPALKDIRGAFPQPVSSELPIVGDATMPPDCTDSALCSH